MKINLYFNSSFYISWQNYTIQFNSVCLHQTSVLYNTLNYIHEHTIAEQITKSKLYVKNKTHTFTVFHYTTTHNIQQQTTHTN